MKSSTSLGFSSSLLFFFFASTAVYSQIPEDCSYMLSVKTGTVAEAGTDSNIGVKCGGRYGESIEIPDLSKWGNMPPGHEYFQSGNLDYFSFPAPCLIVPLISMITVTSDGRGQKPKWYLEYVKAMVVKSPLTVSEFEFNQWLATDEPPYNLMASRRRKENGGLSSTINKSINDF